jgi:TIR domain
MRVFLSHSTKDKQFVQALARELEAEKIEPWLCEVDIEFGHNFVAKIEEGLRDADLTVLFWSPEAARSDWTRLEWTAVTAREISGFFAYPCKKVRSRITPPKRSRFRSGFQPIPERFRPRPQALAVYGIRSVRID